jgi:hypothetical protein
LCISLWIRDVQNSNIRKSVIKGKKSKNRGCVVPSIR